MGYGESKWVAENLLIQASKETGLRTHVVRVGQLCGDSIVGAWNEKEWLPAMVRGSQILGAVPQMDEVHIALFVYRFWADCGRRQYRGSHWTQLHRSFWTSAQTQ